MQQNVQRISTHKAFILGFIEIMVQQLRASACECYSKLTLEQYDKYCKAISFSSAKDQLCWSTLQLAFTPNLDNSLHYTKENSPGRKMQLYCNFTALVLFFLQKQHQHRSADAPPSWQLCDDSLIRLSAVGDTWEGRMFGDVGRVTDGYRWEWCVCCTWHCSQ